MPRIPTRDYQVGIPDGQRVPYQDVEGAGALGKQIGGSLSSIAGDVFQYQATQNLVDARLKKIERDQEMQQSLANVRLDIQSAKLDAINSPDPEASYVKGIEALQQKWQQQFGGDEEFNRGAGLLARASGLDVRAAAIRQREQTAVGRFGNTIDTLMRSGGMSGSDAERADNIRQADGVIDNAVANGVIRADQGDAQKQKYRAGLDELTLRRIGEQNPDAALSALRGGRFEALDADKRQGFTENYLRASEADARQRQADLDRQRAIEERDKAESNAWFAKDLERDIRGGTKGLKEIEAARADHRLTPTQYDSLTTTADKVNRDKIKRDEGMARVAGAIGGSVILDPKNSDDRNNVDAYYIERTQSLRSEEILPLAETITQTTGIIPPTLLGQLNGAMRGSPDQRAWAADMLMRTNLTKPTALDDVPTETMRAARLVQADIQAGLTPTEASRHVDEQLYGATDPVRRLRREKMIAGGDGSPANKAWKSAIGASGLRSDKGFWPFDRTGMQGLGNLATNAEVQTEFMRVFGDAFESHGNQAEAEKEAADAIKKNWRMTSVDGADRWMRYAPELVYGGGDPSSSEWLREQLYEHVAAALPAGAAPDMSTLRIHSDYITAREMQAGQPPSYSVWVADNNGNPNVAIAADGSRMRWTPDPKAYQDKLAAESEQEKAARRARAEARRDEYRTKYELQGRGGATTEFGMGIQELRGAETYE